MWGIVISLYLLLSASVFSLKSLEQREPYLADMLLCQFSTFYKILISLTCLLYQWFLLIVKKIFFSETTCDEIVMWYENSLDIKLFKFVGFFVNRIRDGRHQVTNFNHRTISKNEKFKMNHTAWQSYSFCTQIFTRHISEVVYEYIN